MTLSVPDKSFAVKKLNYKAYLRSELSKDLSADFAGRGFTVSTPTLPAVRPLEIGSQLLSFVVADCEQPATDSAETMHITVRNFFIVVLPFVICFLQKKIETGL